LLDTVITLDKAEALSSILPKDTAIARAIIENGTRDEDYLGFFQRKGYHVSKIKLNDFNKLPLDSLKYTRKEKQLLDEYNKLMRNADSLMKKGDTIMALNKEMQNPRFSEVIAKDISRHPILFVIFGIYRYRNLTLVLYYSAIRPDEYNVTYQIYSS